MKKQLKLKIIGLVCLVVGAELLVYPNFSSARRVRTDSFFNFYFKLFPSLVKLVTSVNVKSGDNVIEVGTDDNCNLALILAYFGCSYTGFTLHSDDHEKFVRRVEEEWKRYDLERFGGSITHIKGYFTRASPASADIEDDSIDFIFGITSVLGDPRPESDAVEVLSEMLRVVKNGGEIITARYSNYELEREEGVIREVLNSDRWKGKVELKKIDSGELDRLYRRKFTRYKVIKKDSEE